MATKLLRDRRHCQKTTIQKNRSGGASLGVFKELKVFWDDFYIKTSAKWRRISIARKLPADNTEDVLQDVWLAAWRERSRFHGKDAVQQLCGWMRQVLHHKITDAFRYRARHRAVSLDALSAEPAAPEEDEFDQERRVWLAERLEETAVEESLNARLLRGRFVDGRSNAELAVMEGLTEKAVESRICRLIAELRQKATEDWLSVPSQEDSSPQKNEQN
jgi:RNA polymerase sigma factor (sigma-70 family)